MSCCVMWLRATAADMMLLVTQSLSILICTAVNSSQLTVTDCLFLIDALETLLVGQTNCVC